MKKQTSIKKILYKFNICIISFVAGTQLAMAASEETNVIELTQTGCQFVETESKDHQFQTKKASDCRQINRKTAKERLSNASPMQLKAGKYIFRVTNKNVPYSLGFWLRGKGLARATLPSVSGGGLAEGVTKDYVITLKPGNYLYSCPLNPTPDYPLIVE